MFFSWCCTKFYTKIMAKNSIFLYVSHSWVSLWSVHSLVSNTHYSRTYRDSQCCGAAKVYHNRRRKNPPIYHDSGKNWAHQAHRYVQTVPTLFLWILNYAGENAGEKIQERITDWRIREWRKQINIYSISRFRIFLRNSFSPTQTWDTANSWWPPAKLRVVCKVTGPPGQIFWHPQSYGTLREIGGSPRELQGTPREITGTSRQLHGTPREIMGTSPSYGVRSEA